MGEQGRKMFKDLALAAEKGPRGLLNAYMDNFVRVLDIKRDPLIRRGRLRSAASGKSLINEVKASAILNDLSCLDKDGSKSMSMTLLAPAGYERVLGAGEVTVGVSQEQFERIQGKPVMIGFCIDDSEPTATYEELSPLIEAGHLIVEPSRVVMYVTKTDEDGTRTFAALDVGDHAGAQQWETISESLTEQSVTVDAASTVSPLEKSVCEIVMPYLVGTTSSDLVKIMQDEADLLAEFRTGVRQLVQDAQKNGLDSSGIIHDVINPRIAKLSRRFTQISQFNKLKTGGALVATATLTLTAGLTGGVAAGLTALAGGTGLVAVAREMIGSRSELNNLRDDPTTYVLWRLRRGS